MTTFNGEASTQVINGMETYRGSFVNNSRVIKDVVKTNSQTHRRCKSIMGFFTTLIVLMVFLRMLFLYFDNASEGFVKVIYGISELYVFPFKGFIDQSYIEGSSIEIASLIALIFYPIFGSIISMIIGNFFKLTEESTT